MVLSDYSRTTDQNRIPPGMEFFIRQARGGGRNLDKSSVKNFSQRLDHDFSVVRIHTGPRSDKINRWLGARAFTIGTDIFFADGSYRPQSPEGKRLIAHELVHVVQQSANHRDVPGDFLTVNPPGNRFEQEADRLAAAVTADGESVLKPQLRTKRGQGKVLFRALAARVNLIPNEFWGPGRPLCPPSVIYWILHDVYGYPPPVVPAQNTALLYAELFRLMIKKASRKTRPARGDQRHDNGKLCVDLGVDLVFQLKQTRDFQCRKNIAKFRQVNLLDIK